MPLASVPTCVGSRSVDVAITATSVAPIPWPPMGQVAHDFLLPGMPKGSKLSEVMLLIIAIVGTTVAPWQLFFQQSYVIDKRIGPRFIAYEKVDLWLGIILVLIGGVAMMAFTSAAFAGTAAVGQFTDAAAVARGLEAHSGRIMGILFAISLIDASIIGAAAVSLSTAYAIGDVFSIRHSLHRKPTEAIGFYGVFGSLIAIAAALVLIPGTPLGLLTNAVQTLAGVLLPSAAVFLLLLCNDKEVLGPWRNGPWLNLFTGAVIGVLVILSMILTASVLFPDISSNAILLFMGIGAAAAFTTWLITLVAGRKRRQPIDRTGKAGWRMPPLDRLTAPAMSLRERLWMGVLRLYLVAAAGLVLFRIVQLALFHHA